MRVQKSLYNHHMLVVEVVGYSTLKVIHYTESTEANDIPKAVQATGHAITAAATAMSSGFCMMAKVVEAIVCVHPEREIIELLEYPEGVAIYTKHRAVRRAKEKRGEQEYNLLFNNCESFANWVITDKRVSEQGQTAAAIGVGAAVVVGAAVITGGLLYALFGGKKDKKVDSDSDH